MVLTLQNLAHRLITYNQIKKERNETNSSSFFFSIFWTSKKKISWSLKRINFCFVLSLSDLYTIYLMRFTNYLSSWDQFLVLQDDDAIWSKVRASISMYQITYYLILFYSILYSMFKASKVPCAMIRIFESSRLKPMF